MYLINISTWGCNISPLLCIQSPNCCISSSYRWDLSPWCCIFSPWCCTLSPYCHTISPCCAWYIFWLLLQNILIVWDYDHQLLLQRWSWLGTFSLIVATPTQPQHLSHSWVRLVRCLEYLEIRLTRSSWTVAWQSLARTIRTSTTTTETIIITTKTII